MNNYNLRIYLPDEFKLFSLNLNKIDGEKYNQIFFMQIGNSNFTEIENKFFGILKSNYIDVVNKKVREKNDKFLSIDFSSEKVILSTIFEENNEL